LSVTCGWSIIQIILLVCFVLLNLYAFVQCFVYHLFYWWRKLEYPEKITDQPQVTDKLALHNLLDPIILVNFRHILLKCRYPGKRVFMYICASGIDFAYLSPFFYWIFALFRHWHFYFILYLPNLLIGKYNKNSCSSQSFC
jgi:hypothetical protein